MRAMSKVLVVGCLIVCLLGVEAFTRASIVRAAGLGEQLLYSGIAVAFINSYYNDLNTHGQKEVLADTQKQTGVYDNEEAAARLKTITNRLKASGLIKENYAVYANPTKEFNAFCTIAHVISVNKGALDTLDDDELAAVLAHEMRHGEGNHPVAGVTKGVSVALAVNLYLNSNRNNASYILSGVTGNYIQNEMFTMSQEWEADNYAFSYMTAAGFNPGGPAASMVKLRSLLGELWAEGFVRVIKPNNHPKTSARITNFSAHLTTYSNGHVTVKNDKTIQLDGKEVLSPVKAFGYMAEERAYLIAGKLAQVYHANSAGPATADEAGNVYMGEQKIAALSDGDITAEEMARRINEIISK